MSVWNKKLAVLPQFATALTKHTWNGAPMAPARYIVMDNNPEDIYLYRFSDNWQFAGDTWHQSMDDALHQIEYEFSVGSLEWRPISEAEFNELTKKFEA